MPWTKWWYFLPSSLPNDLRGQDDRIFLDVDPPLFEKARGWGGANDTIQRFSERVPSERERHLTWFHAPIFWFAAHDVNCFLWIVYSVYSFGHVKNLSFEVHKYLIYVSETDTFKNQRSHRLGMQTLSSCYCLDHFGDVQNGRLCWQGFYRTMCPFQCQGISPMFLDLVFAQTYRRV